MGMNLTIIIIFYYSIEYGAKHVQVNQEKK